MGDPVIWPRENADKAEESEAADISCCDQELQTTEAICPRH